MAAGDQKEAERQSRKERQTERQRHDIIDAAARAFVHAGYEATTMRAIAKEAGFTASSLYTYFESKEEIFNALLQRVVEETQSLFLKPMPTGLTFAQRLELLMLRQLELVESKRDAYTYLARLACEGDGPSSKKDDLRYLEGLSNWIESQARPEDLGQNDLQDVVYFVWGVQHGFFVQWMQTGHTTRLKEKVPVMVKLILKGLSS